MSGRNDHIEAGLAELLIRASRQHGGRVADYIPELAQVDPDRFGIAMTSVLGRSYRAGDEAANGIAVIEKAGTLVNKVDLSLFQKATASAYVQYNKDYGEANIKKIMDVK